jgi:hypothetical protein
MTRECGAGAHLPPSLAVLALSRLQQIGTRLATDLLVERDLQCFLEAHTEGVHYGLVTDTSGDAPDVWTTWSGANPPTTLTHVAACPEDNGETGGLQDVCALFTHHPGRCTFDLGSPGAETVRPAPGHALTQTASGNRSATLTGRPHT